MRVGIFALVLVVALLTGLARIPLAWVMPTPSITDWQNISYVGTVWDGAVTNIPGIGQIGVRTRPTRLLSGQPPIEIEARAPSLTGRIYATLGGDMSGRVSGDMSALSHIDVRMAELEGSYEADIQRLRYKQVCEHAEGEIKTDILTRNQASLGWAGPELLGPIACEDDKLVLNLAGRDTQQAVDVKLIIQPDQTFRLNVSVDTQDPRAGSVLPLYGFERFERGYRLSEQGRWQ